MLSPWFSCLPGWAPAGRLSSRRTGLRLERPPDRQRCVGPVLTERLPAVLYVDGRGSGQWVTPGACVLHVRVVRYIGLVEGREGDPVGSRNCMAGADLVVRVPAGQGRTDTVRSVTRFVGCMAHGGWPQRRRLRGPFRAFSGDDGSCRRPRRASLRISALRARGKDHAPVPPCWPSRTVTMPVIESLHSLNNRPLSESVGKHALMSGRLRQRQKPRGVRGCTSRKMC